MVLTFQDIYPEGISYYLLMSASTSCGCSRSASIVLFGPSLITTLVLCSGNIVCVLKLGCACCWKRPNPEDAPPSRNMNGISVMVLSLGSDHLLHNVWKDLTIMMQMISVETPSIALGQNKHPLLIVFDLNPTWTAMLQHNLGSIWDSNQTFVTISSGQAAIQSRSNSSQLLQSLPYPSADGWIPSWGHGKAPAGSGAEYARELPL